MGTQTPPPEGLSDPAESLPEALEVGQELSQDGQIYVIVEEEPATPFERRYRISAKGEQESLLWLRHRSSDDQVAGFGHELACLRHLHEGHPFFLVPRVVDHFSRSGEEMLVLRRTFGPSLLDRFGELEQREALALCLEQVLLALSKIHQAGYVVTDLRPASFVWPNDGLIELVELSNVTPVGAPPDRFDPGPFGDPEFTRDTKVDFHLDIFAVGAMFAAVLLQRELEPATDYRMLSEECDVAEPVITQLVKGALADSEHRFQSVDEMRTLVYQLKNEQVRIRRPVAATASTVGISRFRYINEDSAGFQDLCFEYQSRPYYFGFFCVADGMGGHELGERASQLSVLGALQAFRQLVQGFSIDFIVEKLPAVALSIGRFASDVVATGATQMGNTVPRMGTTFTGVLVVNDEFGVVHVGDSRALLIREGHLTQLTLDHSLVAALVRVGQLDREEAETLNGRNVLIRCIDATTPMSESDFDGLTAIGAKDGRMKVHPGDRIVLITDGVWGALNPTSIYSLAAQGDKPQEIADRIVRAALDAGSEDNATAVVILWP